MIMIPLSSDSAVVVQEYTSFLKCFEFAALMFLQFTLTNWKCWARNLLTLHPALQGLGLPRVKDETRRNSPVGQGYEQQFGNYRSLPSEGRWVVRSLKWIVLHFSLVPRIDSYDLLWYHILVQLHQKQCKSWEISLLCNSRVKATSFLWTELQFFCLSQTMERLSIRNSFYCQTLFCVQSFPAFITSPLNGLGCPYFGSQGWEK